MNGTLAEGVLPGVLRELYVERRTGLLQFAREGEQRGVYFRRGHIGHARTNVQSEWLGSVLMRMGRLSEVDLDRATAVVKLDGKRLGVVLRELELVDKDGLEDGLAEQVRQVLGQVMTWNEGEYSFEEKDDDAPLDEEITLKLSTGELILESVRRVQDPDVVRYALGDIDRVLAASSDPLLRFQQITFSPGDGYLLSRIDGTLTAREVLSLVPVAQADAQRSLFGLLCTGVVEYTADPPRRPARPADLVRFVSPGAALPPPEAATAPEPPKPPPATAATASAAPPVSPPLAVAAAPPVTSPNLDATAEDPVAERRSEIVEAFDNLRKRTHFEVLGLPRSANEAQVKEAYFRLAKRFHPDVHHHPSLSDLRDKLEAVFIRLGEAYEVLRNPRSRGEYENRLGRARPEAAGAPAAEDATAPDPAVEQQRAQDRLRMAEKLAADGKYWDAIQFFEAALPGLDGKLRLRARVGLARVFLKNPHWQKRAEETLLGVLQEDPRNVEARLELGALYREKGLRSRALSEYRKVLELQPDNRDAQAASVALAGDAPPEPAPEGGGGGLLKKLFGKR